VLVYGNRREDQIVYREELEAFDRDQFTTVVLVLGEPPENWPGYSGMADAELVRNLFGDPDRRKWTYMICGPAPMLDTVEDALIEIGVPARQILSEKFEYD
jgi:ferredoxin-NADP reductase